MIDMRKTYRTRDGREVRIYAVNIGHSLPAHGAYLDEKEWRIWSWWGTGRSGNSDDHSLDLIEVKPRIKRTMWINVYLERTGSAPTREAADMVQGNNRLACVKVEIDCEEGEGL